MKVSQKWLVWFVAVAFFAFQFVLRLVPGLLMPELMAQFKVGAMDFGILSASYYLGYSGMQIPIGIMLDRYHPRNILATCAFICTLGILPFIYSTSWNQVILGRFLIGMGSAAGFLGTAKIIRTFFSESKFTFMIGLSFSFGLMGALYGGKPTSLLIDKFGWHQVGLILVCVCLSLSFAFYFLIPAVSSSTAEEALQNAGSKNSIASASSSSTAKENETGSERQLGVLASLRELLNYPKLFWIALAGAMMVGPLEGFADVWGISYLVNVYGYSKSQASLVASFIYFGMLFGGPILSFFIQKYNAFYQVLSLCGLLMALSFTLLLLGTDTLSPSFLICLMSFVGVLCCYQVVVFGLACRIVPARLSGLATSVTNCINMVAGSFFHLAMGWIMDYHWAGAFEDGIKIYENKSYISAISVIPVLLAMGFIGFVIMQKSFRSPETLPQG